MKSPPQSDPTPRRRWLADDGVLLDQCRIDTYRASGPGGQKRNKTSSAVRLRHGPTGLIVIAEESRSQHENKARALRRMRFAIALNLREPVNQDWRPPDVFCKHVAPSGRIEVSTRNKSYPLVVAAILDAVAARAGRVREAAALLGITTGQLTKFLGSDGKVMDMANRIRRDEGLGPLTG